MYCLDPLCICFRLNKYIAWRINFRISIGQIKYCRTSFDLCSASLLLFFSFLSFFFLQCGCVTENLSHWGWFKSLLWLIGAKNLHVLQTLLLTFCMWLSYLRPLVGSEALNNSLLTCAWLHRAMHQNQRSTVQTPHTYNSVSFFECWCDSGWQIERGRTKAEAAI